MKQPRETSEEEPAGVPAWIVSYSDMVTLLLAFFVLLQVFSMTRDPELFQQGRGSFRSSISGFGLPRWLFGEKQVLIGDHKKKKYTTEESNEATRQRVIDVEDRRIRQVFQDLKRLIDTETSDETSDRSAGPVNVIDTPIHFGRSQSSLDAAARKYLSNLAVNINQNLAKGGGKIYVVGLAPDEPPGKLRWLLSARRAKAVQGFLQQALWGKTATPGWSLVSRGLGAGQLYDPRADRTAEARFIRIVIQQGS